PSGSIQKNSPRIWRMPEPARLVVVNTTPIIALVLADQLPLLRHLYTTVMIPPAVQAEIRTGGPSGIGISVAERSFPLLDLVEMNCQPRAQLLLHRWG